MLTCLGPVTWFHRCCVFSHLPPKASSIAVIDAPTLANTQLCCDVMLEQVSLLSQSRFFFFFSFQNIEKWKPTQNKQDISGPLLCFRCFLKRFQLFSCICVCSSKHLNTNACFMDAAWQLEWLMFWLIVWFKGQVFLPSEMPRSFLVKRGGLYSHRPTARSRSPEPAPVALDHAGDVKLSCDLSLGHSCSAPPHTVSQQGVQAAGHSDESGSSLQKTQNSTLNLPSYMSVVMFLRYNTTVKSFSWA